MASDESVPNWATDLIRDVATAIADLRAAVEAQDTLSRRFNRAVLDHDGGLIVLVQAMQRDVDAIKAELATAKIAKGVRRGIAVRDFIAPAAVGIIVGITMWLLTRAKP